MRTFTSMWTVFTRSGSITNPRICTSLFPGVRLFTEEAVDAGRDVEGGDLHKQRHEDESGRESSRKEDGDKGEDEHDHRDTDHREDGLLLLTAVRVADHTAFTTWKRFT